MRQLRFVDGIDNTLLTDQAVLVVASESHREGGRMTRPLRFCPVAMWVATILCCIVGCPYILYRRERSGSLDSIA